MQFKRAHETVKDEVLPADRSLRIKSDRRSGHRNPKCLPPIEIAWSNRIDTGRRVKSHRQRSMPNICRLHCVLNGLCLVQPVSADFHDKSDQPLRLVILGLIVAGVIPYEW
jgi:hypothetical protein